MVKGICKNCGKEYEYEPKKGSYKLAYCSVECKTEFNRKDNEPQYRICQECGKEYWWDGTIKLYGVKGNYVDSKKFCCHECGKKNRYEKVKKTTTEHFGGIGYASKELLKRCQDTAIDRYGNKNNIEKIKQTNLERYGVEVVSKAFGDKISNKLQKVFSERGDEIREKKKATNLEKYGVEWAAQTSEVKEKSKQTCLEKYGVENGNQAKEVREKTKQYFIDKYGVENYSQTAECKEKVATTWKNKSEKDINEILTKRKNTSLEKYGAEYPQTTIEVKEKIKQTCLKKYGTKAAICSETVQTKIKNNNLKKYGVEYAIAASEVKDKIKQTNLERYGFEYLFQNKELRKEMEIKRKQTNLKKYNTEHISQVPEFKEKSIETCLKKYGVPYNCLTDQCMNTNNTISKINLRFKAKLDELGIKNELEFRLENKSYDIKCDNVLIEINPTFTHNSSKVEWKGKFKIEPKEEGYHQEKTIVANKNGYRCIHIWDWDDEDKLLEMLKEKKTLYARNLIIGKVSKKDTTSFLEKYHLQNSCNGQEIRLGLYKNSELIEIMTFGKPRYNKHYEWELLRLCTKSEYKVVGGAEKLFKYFIKQYNPKSIISYCDNSKFSGNVYLKLGMKLKTFGQPSKHWFNIFTFRHITDNLLRQRGYSQLHKDTIHQKGESNELLMLENGYLEMYDCGQSTYTWKNKTKPI